mgnify:CR=1 FL=1
MSKKEKIIAFCFIASFVLLVASAIYVIIQNKPIGYTFRAEKVLKNVTKNLHINNN